MTEVKEWNNESVRYVEKDAIAIITISRPAKLNTLTEEIIQGVSDGIDEATASRRMRRTPKHPT